jgi:hypothetical protein
VGLERIPHLEDFEVYTHVQTQVGGVAVSHDLTSTRQDAAVHAQVLF